MIAWMLVQTWRGPRRPAVVRLAAWLLVTCLLEALLQVLMLLFGFKVVLLVPYTLTAAAFWGLLVALLAQADLDASLLAGPDPRS